MNETLLSLTSATLKERERERGAIWACDPQHIDLIDPNFDHHGLHTKRVINTLFVEFGGLPP